MTTRKEVGGNEKKEKVGWVEVEVEVGGGGGEVGLVHWSTIH